MAKSISRIVLLKLCSFLLFLILLAVAYSLIPYFNNQIYLLIIGFFLDNILFLFGILAVDIVNDIFWSMRFPFNSLAPVSGATLGALIVTLIYRILTTAFPSIWIPYKSILILVILIVSVSGYMLIISRIGVIECMKSNKIDWEDVRKELRKGLFHLGKAVDRIVSEFKKPNRRKGNGRV